MDHIHHDDIEHIDLAHEDSQDVSGHHGAHHRMVPAVETGQEYKKFAYIIAGIVLFSVLLTSVRGWSLGRFMADLMAVFFITFATFKFIDLEGFAHGYRNYDIIAKRLRPWPYFFPFLEAFLGVWYLMSEAPIVLNILTLLITGTASIGVFREVRRKSRFQCACLGTFIRLPLSRVSLVENLSMFVMAAIMLIV